VRAWLAKTLLLFAKQSTRCIRSKIATYKLKLSETVARRRRKIVRISDSRLYFVKENRHENSAPQAKILKV